MISRRIGSFLTKGRRSFLLLGPRQTGKSTLVASLEPALTINLMHEPTYLDFARNPRELEERIDALPRERSRRAIFIDEVQRLPSLLNTLQVLLDEPGGARRFWLTGSSARKLRRGGANLLPGRIHEYRLGPIVAAECRHDLDTRRALSLGTLPAMLTGDDVADARKTLRTYAATYLKEEVQAEALTRNLEGFARFLTVAAERAGQLLDLSKLASTAAVARQSAVRFFEILEDSLVVHRLSPFSKSSTRRLVQHPKYYFFDVGVLNGLLGNFEASADRIGNLFEHLVVTQIIHSAAAFDREIRPSTFRTEHGLEVDVVCESGDELWAVEIKASRNVGAADLRGLRAFADFTGRKARLAVFYLGEVARRVAGVDVLPWQQGLEEMGF
ncbi:MAG: ATP-binding protein [Deltaproteobacteria bacterium]|nr:ATP-binding protein [Deltaproteobacteria bacterium]